MRTLTLLLAMPAALLAWKGGSLRPGEDANGPSRRLRHDRPHRKSPRRRRGWGGESSKETAAALGLSARTVEGHRRAILRKMEVSSAAALAGLLSRTGA